MAPDTKSLQNRLLVVVPVAVVALPPLQAQHMSEAVKSLSSLSCEAPAHKVGNEVYKPQLY